MNLVYRDPKMLHRARGQGVAGLRAKLMALGLALLLGGCAQPAYYWQSVQGHWQLMRAARPITQWLAQDDLDPRLRARLMLAQQVRNFAVEHLALPDNASYQAYADIGRPYVVWNVVATPRHSLKLTTWCFPVLGCVGYRGYYEQAEANAFAATLRAQDLDVYVYGVPAYSTLGWLNWAGGDPLLSSVTRLPAADMARLMFHELAHQVVYVGSDTVFDESFATAVERLGVQQWLKTQANDAIRQRHAIDAPRRQAFLSLVRQTRTSLQALYEPADGSVLQGTHIEAGKAQLMAKFRTDYEALKQQWGGWGGYDAWVAQANNAAFAAQAAYDSLVPAFEALFAQSDQDWSAFYATVRRLADLPAADRQRALDDLVQQTPVTARMHAANRPAH
jgi:predicted aminopeptidase